VLLADRVRVTSSPGAQVGAIVPIDRRGRAVAASGFGEMWGASTHMIEANR
jgi:hypothetical protein